MPKNNLPVVLTRGVAEILPQAETLAALMSSRKIRVFLGIDPTGSLLTLGHSVVLRKLQQFAELGHQVILLIGNGTVKIGDPTGRDSTRPVLTDEVINDNFKHWRSQASKILDFSKIEIQHNGDWLDKLTYADMVKLLAQTTVQQLLERDMFQQRLKQGLPIYGHEIIYPLLQGYDSVAMDIDLELGGTDQTFNMMMGRHLQKTYQNREKWVLTTPIINGSDGRKMSKSFQNFIALTEPANDMYGKLMAVTDDVVVEYFTLLTDVPLSEIAAVEQAMAAGENPMQFKKLLAHTITRQYHDQAAADQAQHHFEKTVQNKELPEQIAEVIIHQPTLSLLDLTHQCQPQASKSNTRRLIEQGGVALQLKGQVNFEKVTNPQQTITISEVDNLKVGKRDYYALRFSP